VQFGGRNMSSCVLGFGLGLLGFSGLGLLLATSTRYDVNLFIPSECWTGSETVMKLAASSGLGLLSTANDAMFTYRTDCKFSGL